MIYFKGRPISELTHEELIQLIVDWETREINWADWRLRKENEDLRKEIVIKDKIIDKALK